MKRFSTVKLVALAIVGAMASSIPATQGPIATPAMAGPGCGGHNQRPCIFPFNPCDRGMVLHKFSNRERGVCKRDEPPPNARNGGTASTFPYDGRGTPTGLLMCNRSSVRELSAAVAFYDHRRSTVGPNWTSMGWWSLRRGECEEIQLTETGSVYDGDIYLMAVGEEGSTWEGEGGTFCIDGDREFYIQDADRVRCGSQEMLNGIQFYVRGALLNTFDFTD